MPSHTLIAYVMKAKEIVAKYNEIPHSYTLYSLLNQDIGSKIQTPSLLETFLKKDLQLCPVSGDFVILTDIHDFSVYKTYYDDDDVYAQITFIKSSF